MQGQAPDREGAPPAASRSMGGAQRGGVCCDPGPKLDARAIIGLARGGGER